MSSIKAARREDAQQFVEEIFECLKHSKCKSDTLRLTRKYYMKIVQRAGLYFNNYFLIIIIIYLITIVYKGLTLLNVRIATWRYDRGTRSLEQNLQSTRTFEKNIVHNEDDDDDDDDVSSILEDIIQELMEGLKDTDIIVRYML